MASVLTETEVLSDQQIEELIQEAEARARAKAGVVTAPEPEDELTLQEETLDFAKRKAIPKLKHGLERESYIQEQHGVAQVKSQVLVTKQHQGLADRLRTLPTKKTKQKSEAADAGMNWFSLPRTTPTAALKRDLQLISMRSVLDPHRHYKKASSKSKIPEFSQTGTVIEGPTEFYSARINRKDRAKNFIDEAMATEKESGRFKRKYSEIQEKKTSGKKAHYKALMKKRKGK